MEWKKLTPIGTTDWYIKWVASAIILIGMCRNTNMTDRPSKTCTGCIPRL